ncbi:helix-turn-helix domain-containing protein [Streptomyces sp. HUAS TT7]|uniref:helix-turn-helix domain-containing protein n=1 Tax=Streptomyces sp. HUAS TT7 TaxID=3447507 RepID=UPI003F65E2D9
MVAVSVVVVQLRYQYRVYPTPGQCISAARVFGCRRVVWNDALARVRPVKASNNLLGSTGHRLAHGPYQQVPKNADLSKLLITQAKRTPERAFLSDAPVGAADVLPPTDGDQGIDLGLTLPQGLEDQGGPPPRSSRTARTSRARSTCGGRRRS